MGPLSYMRSVVDRNVVMRRMTVINKTRPRTTGGKVGGGDLCLTRRTYRMNDCQRQSDFELGTELCL